MKNLFKLTFFICAVLIFTTCKKDQKVNPTYQWFKEGTKFNYDYYTGTTIKKNFRSLSVITDTKANLYLLETTNPDSLIEQLYFTKLQGEYVVKSDGLYVIRPVSCEGNVLITNTFSSLFAPDSPAAGQQMPVYLCQNELYYTIKIQSVNQKATVPYGTFNTYIMQYGTGDKGYWDPKTGLIMYEVYDANGNITGTLKLSSITYSSF